MFVKINKDNRIVATFTNNVEWISNLYHISIPENISVDILGLYVDWENNKLYKKNELVNKKVLQQIDTENKILQISKWIESNIYKIVDLLTGDISVTSDEWQTFIKQYKDNMSLKKYYLKKIQNLRDSVSEDENNDNKIDDKSIIDICKFCMKNGGRDEENN